jgi:hypothetical protein
MLNPAIIARDLGLADKKDHTSSDGSMSPKESPIDKLAAFLEAKTRTDGTESG